jgi:NAD(P)-dependent dehydrogenase (short-subunit alcohol dehydrogenase family)
MSTDSLFRLDGRTALVTGATGILGRRICHALAESGANLVAFDILGDQAVALASDLAAEHGVGALGLEVDVSDPQSIAKGLSQAVDRFKHIHVLHNNAASKSSDLNEFFAPFEEYSLDQWREVMSVNIDGMFLMAQAVGKHMVQAGLKGSIIQTSSIYGVVGPDQRIYEGSHYLGRQINTPAVYSASKAAVIGLTRYLATYWGSAGIRVNALTPGGVESGQNDVFSQRYSARVPLGRMARDDEMTGALIFLASDASSYMTGQNLIVDGGLTAW